MGIWESINKVTSNLSTRNGEQAVVKFANGSQLPVLAIIGRDSARIVPNENENGFYEILDGAVGQYRTKIDFGMTDGSPLVINTGLLNARIESGSEAWVVEYVVGRDTYIVKTLCRKV